MTDTLRGSLLHADGRRLGDVLDDLRSVGYPVHLISRVFNDLLSERRLTLDTEQTIRVTR